MAEIGSYVARYKADASDFQKGTDKAKAELAKLKAQGENSSKAIKAGFDSMIKMAGAFGVAISATKIIMDTFNGVIGSTQTTQDAWNMIQAKTNAGLNEFYRTIATGDWSNFIDNIKEAIKLAGDYEAFLDKYGTDKIRNSFIISSIDTQIAQQKKLFAEAKKEYGENSAEAKKHSDEIKRLQKERYDEQIYLHQSALDAATASARMQVKNEKISLKDVEEALKSSNAAKLKENSDYNKELVRRANQTAGWRTIPGTISTYRETPEEAADRIAATKELAERRASSDIFISSADYIEESADDLEQTIKLGIEANNIIKSLADEERGELKFTAGAINTVTKSVEKYNAELVNKTRLDKLNLTIQEKLNKINSNAPTIKTIQQSIKTPAIKSAIPSSFSVGMEGFQDAKRYQEITDRIHLYNDAIEKQTILYGKQSEQVKKLSNELKEYRKQEGLPPVANGEDANNISLVASSISELSSAVSQVSDNPALRALAASMAILSAVEGISKATTWQEKLVAMVAMTTATLNMMSQLSNSKFASGGIVGDRDVVRMNAGSEMILNSDQQARLFRQLNGEGDRTNSSTQTVEVKIKGTDLVGVLNNVKSKYK